MQFLKLFSKYQYYQEGKKGPKSWCNFSSIFQNTNIILMSIMTKVHDEGLLYLQYKDKDTRQTSVMYLKQI